MAMTPAPATSSPAQAFSAAGNAGGSSMFAAEVPVGGFTPSSPISSSLGSAQSTPSSSYSSRPSSRSSVDASVAQKQQQQDSAGSALHKQQQDSATQEQAAEEEEGAARQAGDGANIGSNTRDYNLRPRKKGRAVMESAPLADVPPSQPWWDMNTPMGLLFRFSIGIGCYLGMAICWMFIVAVCGGLFGVIYRNFSDWSGIYVSDGVAKLSEWYEEWSADA